MPPCGNLPQMTRFLVFQEKLKIWFCTRNILISNFITNSNKHERCIDSVNALDVLRPASWGVCAQPWSPRPAPGVLSARGTGRVRSALSEFQNRETHWSEALLLGRVLPSISQEVSPPGPKALVLSSSHAVGPAAVRGGAHLGPGPELLPPPLQTFPSLLLIQLFPAGRPDRCQPRRGPLPLVAFPFH